MHFNGWTLVEAAFALVIVASFWKLRKVARVISLGITAIFLLGVIAVPIWRDALAVLFSTGPGMVVLIALTGIGVGFKIYDHFNHHDPVRTAILGGIGATAGFMAVLMWPQLRQRATQFGPQTQAAIGSAMQDVRSGHAAHSMSITNAAMIVVVVLLIAVAVFRALHRRHRADPFTTARGFREITGPRQPRAIAGPQPRSGQQFRPGPGGSNRAGPDDDTRVETHPGPLRQLLPFGGGKSGRR